MSGYEIWFDRKGIHAKRYHDDEEKFPLWLGFAIGFALVAIPLLWAYAQ